MRTTAILAAAVALGLTAPADAGEVRIMWYSDGVEGAVFEDLIARFEAEHPEIDVTVDNVAYQTIQEQLPIQLEAGQGPDIARVTNLKALAEHWLDLTPYLDDPQYWRTSFGAQLDWMRPDGSEIIPGFMTQLTITGGFANATLFEQAGVALPGDEATWADWVEAAQAVAQDQQLPFAFAIDRSGHRISGPIASYGGDYIGADRAPAPLDDGAKALIADFVGWNESGAHARDVWVSAAGTTYRAAADDFVNAQVPYYYSGSWQVANLSSKIGDAFDWVATGSPCGPAGCSGLQGGAALVAIKYTQNPEDVATVMEFLAREDVVREFSERTLFLPAHAAVAEAGGLDWQSEDRNVVAALDAFNAASADVLPAAAALPGWTWGSLVYGALVNRISQVIAGELSLEDAYARIDQDVAAGYAEATRTGN